jgi:hypothetical protein
MRHIDGLGTRRGVLDGSRAGGVTGLWRSARRMSLSLVALGATGVGHDVSSPRPVIRGCPYGRQIASGPSCDLSDVLEAVESASPVDAVDALTGKLAAELGTDRVAFLITDLAGRAVVRLGHDARAGAGGRRFGVESAQTLPLTDGMIGASWRNSARRQLRRPKDGACWRR